MPGAPIRIDLRVGRLGEGAMHAVAVGAGGPAVDGRSDERVCELDARPHL